MASDDRQVNRQKARLIDYQAAFKSEAGMRVLSDMLIRFYMSSSFDKDPYSTAFNEGRRYVVMYILDKLKTTPDKLDTLIERAVEHEYNG